MKQKTISGHYGTAFSLEHNNRSFLPHNADPSRVKRNRYYVAAGGSAYLRCGPKDMQALWRGYRELSKLYWEDRQVRKEQYEDPIREYMSELASLRYELSGISHDPVLALFQLLILPLRIAACVVVSIEMEKAKAELEDVQLQMWIEAQTFKYQRETLRDTLRSYDRKYGTQLLNEMDDFVRSRHMQFAQEEEETISVQELSRQRFATLEEIYDKCFEPGFRQFQERQRPCRRYQGTYLEQIREKTAKEVAKGARNESSRSVAEAIEFVFCIGDMDNTGYEKAPQDAEMSEWILKAFCEHLLEDPQICVVTTKELEDPSWQPPFRNGLILLNLTAHFDEATPGIHMTCIPYSRGCKRGPNAQASLGRAMTGMGYPSTWKPKLDETGLPIPKRDRNGQVILEKDGTPRIQKESDQQGVIDWIETQKVWLQKEMLIRYGWNRQYKGSHPRGSLSIPDYKVARAEERLIDAQQKTRQALYDYQSRVDRLTKAFQGMVNSSLDSATEGQALLQFLRTCPDDRYEELLNEAIAFLENTPQRERIQAMQTFQETLQNAQKRADVQRQDEGKRQQPGQFHI